MKKKKPTNSSIIENIKALNMSLNRARQTNDNSRIIRYMSMSRF